MVASLVSEMIIRLFLNVLSDFIGEFIECVLSSSSFYFKEVFAF